MENIDKNSVFWNHMTEEEKKLFLETTSNEQNIQDDELSAQYEHTVLVTKDGSEILTLRPEEDEDEFK